MVWAADKEKLCGGGCRAEDLSCPVHGGPPPAPAPERDMLLIKPSLSKAELVEVGSADMVFQESPLGYI